MEIVSIFANRLFAIHYDNEPDDEVGRLLDLWTDPSYLQAYGKRNDVSDVYRFIEDILTNAEELQDTLNKIEQCEQSLSIYFQPLQTSEYGKIMSLQKGKIRNNFLRLYALKIDDDCYLITGGAIKMSRKMADHPDTALELEKLNQARSYLNQRGVFDQDSFLELINE